MILGDPVKGSFNLQQGCDPQAETAGGPCSLIVHAQAAALQELPAHAKYSAQLKSWLEAQV